MSPARAAAVPETPAVPLDYGPLDGLIGYQLRRAFLRSNALFGKLAAPAGLAPGQFGVLTLIARNPGRSQTEIAAAAGLDRSSLTQALDQLAERGFVERRPGPDRRTFHLHATPAGASALIAARARVNEHETAIRADLTEAEAATLLALLKRLGG